MLNSYINVYKQIYYFIVRGRRAAVPNVGLAIGIQDSTIGNKKAQQILASSHIPPPCNKSMQSLANKASEKIAELNAHDMQMKRQKLRRLVETTSGRKGVNISIDA